MSLTVLLADLPHLLEDVVGGVLEGSEEFHLVRNSRTGGDIALAALEAGADVVVVTRKDPADLASIDWHLAGLAGLSALALTPAGDAAWLHRCRYEATHLGELSANSVLAALQACKRQSSMRSAARRGADASAMGVILEALRGLDIRLSAAAEAVKVLFGPESSRDLFRGLHIAPADAAQALRRPAAVPLFGPLGFRGPLISPEALSGTRFEQLSRTCDLSSFDLDVLLLVLAPEVDTRYERLYAFIQDDVAKKRPTIDLALNLLSTSIEDKFEHLQRFRADAPLVRHGLIRVGASNGTGEPSRLSCPLAIDEVVVCHLLAHLALDARIAPYARLLPPAQGVPIGLASRTTNGMAGEETLYIRGFDQEEILAIVRGSSTEESVLVLDAERALSAGADWESVLDVAMRSARLMGQLLLIQDIDRLWDVEQRPRLHQLLQRLLQHRGLVYLSGAVAWRSVGERGPAVVSIDLEPISPQVRQRAWEEDLARYAAHAPPSLVAEVAVKFDLTRAQVAAGARHAVHVAIRRGHARLSRDDLHEAARLQTRSALLGLADRFEVQATWDDLVLPSDTLTQLREIASRVAHRTTVLGLWGFGQKRGYGNGTAVLFTGPSGTGKTFAAAVFARELGFDLYRIDLSSVVSKYIGETEKNLARVFDGAKRSNAILLFDEAEAIFGKRSEVRDAHDRYANQELAYLLQRIEEFDGLAILTTNLPGSMDEAFRRRLAMTVYFPPPDEAARRRLWKRAWPAGAPVAPDVDVGLLATQFEIPGGVIAQAALGAAYLAAESAEAIAMRHVLHALRRELEALGSIMPSALGSVMPELSR